MSNEILLIAVTALVLGGAGGFALARIRRRPPVPPPLSTLPHPREALVPEDETQPTLVPYREHRESGRNLAKLKPDDAG